jgi:D-glycero-D-manno-heptose 1,7-bisphosphate phosphatase
VSTEHAQPAVFFDRDGVLNAMVASPGGPPRPPWELAELTVFPEAVQACGLLRREGFVLIAVTNQPDIARGVATAEAVREINDAVVASLDLEEVVTCPHGGAEHCSCRKPAPGMILDVAARRRLHLPSSWLVGDRWVDIAAGRAAGVRTILVEHATSWLPTSSGAPPRDLSPEHRVANAMGAARVIAQAVR